MKSHELLAVVVNMLSFVIWTWKENALLQIGVSFFKLNLKISKESEKINEKLGISRDKFLSKKLIWCVTIKEIKLSTFMLNRK